jgi:choline transport protein
MMWTAILNGTLGFGMLVTFCFCLGDVDTILSNPDIMPFVQVFFIATNSHVGTSIMTGILIILTICGCITNVGIDISASVPNVVDFMLSLRYLR